MIRGTKRPRVRAVEIIESKAQKIDVQLNASIHNRFDVEVIDARTGEIKQRAQAENVICNQLWTRLLAPATFFGYVHYGTGSGTPAATDTALFTFLGYGTPASADDVYNFDFENHIASIRRKIQLLETTAVGSTLTEVGIGYATTAATLCTHAMLKDMNGNAISIAKTNTDIINIYATVYVHYNDKFTPVTTNALLKWLLGVATPSFAKYSLYTGGKVAVFEGYPSTNCFVSATSNSVAYSASNKTVTISCPRVAASEANISGIMSISIGASSYPYLYLTPEDVGLGTCTVTGEAVGTGDGSTRDFSTDFPFIDSATIYVDGVQTNEVSIDQNKPLLCNAMGLYFILTSCSNMGSNAPKMNPEQETTASDAELPAGANAVYYNPYYNLGITSFYSYGGWVEVSNDKTSWITLSKSSSAGTVDVPVEYQTYKYWRFTKYYSNNSFRAPGTFTTAGASTTNIHFVTPPVPGAVITADCTTKAIAKDANHVFELTVTITLGEKTT